MRDRQYVLSMTSLYIEFVPSVADLGEIVLFLLDSVIFTFLYLFSVPVIFLIQVALTMCLDCHFCFSRLHALRLCTKFSPESSSLLEC